MLVIGETDKIERASVAAALTLAQDVITKAIEDMPECWLSYKTEFVEFVTDRIPQLANKVIACFPKPQKDLLSP